MKQFNPDKEFRKSNRKISKKQIFISLSVLMVFTVIGLSFALFNLENKEYIVLNGKVGEFTTSDIVLKVMVDGVEQDSFPAKDDGYVFEEVVCTNGSTGTWDESTWELSVSFSGSDNCVISFKTKLSKICLGQNAAGCISENGITYASNEVNNDDPDGNIRFMGKNPNNYVSFNGETWRIIGVFNVKNATTGVTEKRMKIIRDSSIGGYSWDSSASDEINNGMGISEWSQADIMTTLNSGAYWNRTSGTCYYSDYDTTIACDFSSIGLTNNAKNMITDIAVWNTGTIDGTNITIDNSTAALFYVGERSNNTGCSNNECNDNVTRTTTWEGKVGLMYPSDYAYATSGGITTTRATCLSYALYNWDSYSDCYSNSWLYDSANSQWTMMPYYNGSDAFYIYDYVASDNAYASFEVYPVVYLNSSVVITDGDGTSEVPYKLG